MCAEDRPTLADSADFPAKNIAGRNGLPIASQFLADALPSNLFPIIYLLPSNQLFMAANKLAMLCARAAPPTPLTSTDDWQRNQEQRLPGFPTRVNCAPT